MMLSSLPLPLPPAIDSPTKRQPTRTKAKTSDMTSLDCLKLVGFILLVCLFVRLFVDE